VCIDIDRPSVSSCLIPLPFPTHQFKHSLPRLGVTVKFANDDDPASFAALIDDRTKALYVETLGNPKYNVPRFPELKALASQHKIPLVVDNTFGAGGAICRPIQVAAAAAAAAVFVCVCVCVC
jgi:O-acetylhomoserine/O-acetylserine sulfhydrylase